MKKLILSTLLPLCSLSAYAGSGKAIVPYWDIATNNQQTNLYITNITEHDLDIKITFYSQDGNEYTGSTIHYKNFINSNSTISARNGAFIHVNSPASGSPYTYGHAVIEWSNQADENDTVGLVAHGWKHSNNGHSAIPVDNGQPF